MQITEIINFLKLAENLKKEVRHSWLSNGRQESVAEHSWRLALMVMLVAPKLQEPVKVDKAVKMAIVHDLSEALVGDLPCFLTDQMVAHQKAEVEAMQKLKSDYHTEIVAEICDLWQECEEQQTPEAKLVKALDRLEVRLQHNEADIKTWNDEEYGRSQFSADQACDYDIFLQEINEAFKKESELKIRTESNKDFKDILDRVKELKSKK